MYATYEDILLYKVISHLVKVCIRNTRLNEHIGIIVTCYERDQINHGLSAFNGF